MPQRLLDSCVRSTDVSKTIINFQARTLIGLEDEGAKSQRNFKIYQAIRSNVPENTNLNLITSQSSKSYSRER